MRLIGLAVILSVSLSLAPLAAQAQAGKVYQIGLLGAQSHSAQSQPISPLPGRPPGPICSPGRVRAPGGLRASQPVCNARPNYEGKFFAWPAAWPTELLEKAGVIASMMR
jgi:hypothetical protein